MINTVVIDEQNNSKELMFSFLKNIENINVVNGFDDFNLENINLKEIDLIIFDIKSSNSDEILEKIRKIKSINNKILFIATSYEINSELVSKTLKEENIKDFILKPILANILENAIKKIQNIKENKFNAKANTICVFSNKGGVGKTSTAVNLAYEIAQKTNEKVCLLDFSFNSQDINTFLNLESKFDINYIYSNIENSDEKLFLSLLNQYKDTSLYVFSTNENINVDFNFTPEITTKIINSLKNIFNWIIIDTSSIINETSVSIINNSDIVLLLGLLNLSSIRNCQKCYELFDNIGYKDDKIKLIVNRFIENSELTINDIKNTLDKNIFYKIPNNYLTLIDAINIGATVKETNPQSNIAKAYKDLAHEILNIDFMSIKEKERTNYNHGIFNLLRRMGE